MSWDPPEEVVDAITRRLERSGITRTDDLVEMVDTACDLLDEALDKLDVVTTQLDDANEKVAALETSLEEADEVRGEALDLFENHRHDADTFGAEALKKIEEWVYRVRRLGGPLSSEWVEVEDIVIEALARRA